MRADGVAARPASDQAFAGGAMKKAVLLVIAVVVAVVSLWSWRHAARPGENRLVADRIWIDHIPRNERDTIRVFAMVSEHSVGVFQATSQWRCAYEVFRYESSGGELRLVFPQTGDRESVHAKARRCSEQGMDFCLELDGASRGVKRYYSREGWEIGGARDLDAIEHQIDAVRAQLAE
jgi:hypothetical protein